MKSSEFSPNTLSHQEKQFFKKSGFIVIRGIGLLSFLTRFTLLGFVLLGIFIPYGIFSLLLSLIVESAIGYFPISYFLYGGLIVYFLCLITLILFYIRGKYLFLSTNSVIAFGKLFNTGDRSYLKIYSIYDGDLSAYPKFISLLKFLKIIAVLSIFAGLALIFKIFLSFGFIGIGWVIGSTLLFQVIVMGLISSIHVFASIFDPLFRFGNLGKKIQSITPHISEQSKQIESEFRGDMDFRVLSKSFDSLASTFSQIVNLVVKLEKVEQKANKGDLFDSAKYINSLREDIRTPLLSLKDFLETKKIELESSQKELMRVRVSVGGESENRELQSIRTNELLKELDENIVKVGVMIGNL